MLSSSRYAAVMREYDRRQAEARAAADAKRAEVYAAYPELARIDDELTASAARRAEARILKRPADEAALAARRKELLAARETLMKKAGLTEEDLQPRFRCPDCRDTGYIGDARCHCFAVTVSELSPAQPEMEEVFARENFSTLSFAVYDDKEVVPAVGTTVRRYMKGVAEDLMAYTRRFGPDSESLLFTGPTGVGKSFLLHCVAAELTAAGFSVLYYTASQLSRLFSRQISDRDDEELQDLDEDILDCDLLIIDDLGTELGNALDATRFFYCINERELHRRPVLLSTNLSMDAAADRYTERVTSRISTYKNIPLYGRDLRRSPVRG